MKNYFLSCFIVLLLANNIEATEVHRRMMSKYYIDYNIKTNKGWRRVCNNNMLHNYTTIPITPEDQHTICSGIMKEKTNKSRAIGSRLR